jgi:hypothetical protein
VKVLYERTAPGGATVKVCKRCRKKAFPVGEPILAADMLKELEVA